LESHSIPKYTFPKAEENFQYLEQYNFDNVKDVHFLINLTDIRKEKGATGLYFFTEHEYINDLKEFLVCFSVYDDECVGIFQIAPYTTSRYYTKRSYYLKKRYRKSTRSEWFQIEDLQKYDEYKYLNVYIKLRNSGYLIFKTEEEYRSLWKRPWFIALFIIGIIFGIVLIILLVYFLYSGIIDGNEFCEKTCTCLGVLVCFPCILFKKCFDNENGEKNDNRNQEVLKNKSGKKEDNFDDKDCITEKPKIELGYSNTYAENENNKEELGGDLNVKKVDQSEENGYTSNMVYQKNTPS
jgi:hypothetical protein